jgi:hypothetical protein
MFGRKKEKRVYEDDDGRVIAPMNVEGMPWYRKEMPGESKNPEHEYTKEQRRYIILGTLKAALLIGLAFIVVFFLLILVLWLVSEARYG